MAVDQLSQAGETAPSAAAEPVPMLAPEQYRFLGFLLAMADSLGVENDQIARMRSAVRLFEQSA